MPAERFHQCARCASDDPTRVRWVLHAFTIDDMCGFHACRNSSAEFFLFFLLSFCSSVFGILHSLSISEFWRCIYSATIKWEWEERRERASHCLFHFGFLCTFSHWFNCTFRLSPFPPLFHRSILDLQSEIRSPKAICFVLVWLLAKSNVVVIIMRLWMARCGTVDQHQIQIIHFMVYETYSYMPLSNYIWYDYLCKQNRFVRRSLFWFSFCHRQ